MSSIVLHTVATCDKCSRGIDDEKKNDRKISMPLITMRRGGKGALKRPSVSEKVSVTKSEKKSCDLHRCTNTIRPQSAADKIDFPDNFPAAGQQTNTTMGGGVLLWRTHECLCRRNIFC